ncbi:hypothetical protein Pcinc_019985 [Petrolisthes cinctipes]|uniref:Kazal-like domain-containing protein n=1 Tax=Petrolisthes cinctipes TaxID=88211 RepID=A0AAE1FL26_PETCI|nr:hypothetical protein Pcinc_019985 [Petrolisthes cinctipes]
MSVWVQHDEFRTTLLSDDGGTLVYPETCEETYQPVCACNGRVYNNKCRFQRAQCRDPQLTVIKTGGCSGEPECPDTCEETFEPVCASDGRVFNNMCRFKKAQCCNADLTVQNTGICSETNMCEEGMTWNMDCNRCGCSNGRVLCTQMACGKFNYISDRISLKGTTVDSKKL